ncbi:MAG: hypothetical protein SGI89_00485 [bacterium]|nr:hypothetical protein [bacterium]
MNNFNDIQNIWNSQSQPDFPDINELDKSIRSDRIKMIAKNIFGTLSLILTLVVITLVVSNFDYKYPSTPAGTILVMIAVTAAIAVNNYLLKIILNKADETSDSRAYLEELIHYRNRQRFFQTKGLAVYFILLSVGLMLYLFEFLMMDITIGITAYLLTSSWIAFVWFYLGPRTIRKQEQKINELISRTRIIADQLSGD